MKVRHIGMPAMESTHRCLPTGIRPAGPARHAARALLATALLAMTPSCGADSAGPNSTEPGNPPLLTSDKILVESEGKVLVVIGEEGAVDPGRSTVTVSNSSNGETASVRSNRDGSFEVRVDGGPEDSLTLVAGSAASGSSQSLTLTQSPVDPSLAGCEAICSAPECGASEFAFPIVGCRCDDGECDCSFDDCVEACRQDMDDYRAQSPDCTAAVSTLLGCMESASCVLLGQEDYETLLKSPACDGVEMFDQACTLGGGAQGCGTVITGHSSGAELSAPDSCEVFVGCADANYGYDCHRTDETGEEYDCVCRVDGLAWSSPSSVSPCGFDGQEVSNGLALMNFRCGWDLPMVTSHESSGCQVTDSIRSGNDSPECELSADCGDAAFSVECVASKDESQVSCSCAVDGEVVFERPLDAQGCLGGADLHDGDVVPSEQTILRAMNALCEWHLTARAE